MLVAGVDLDTCRDKAVETMDMSVVSRELEKETKSSILGTVNGRIPRILLIQVRNAWPKA